MAVILNIEFDHADYFKNISHVTEAFGRFARLVPPDGYVVACTDTPKVQSILTNLKSNVVDCSISRNDSTWQASDITFDSSGCASFNILEKNILTAQIRLNVPGLHNVSNALAASAACLTLGIDASAVERGLLNFKGTHRRFEYKGEKDNIKVIDDYAHHPSEIKATLKAVKRLRHKNIWCVFQPHTYTRTKALLDEFTGAFDDADKIIVTDIYAAREKDTGEISSSILAEKIRTHGKDALYMKSFEDIVQHLINNVPQGDIILTMGAGDIYRVGEMYFTPPCPPSQS
jgi:UDP-N-acetylmuramate--alanine ligase